MREAQDTPKARAARRRGLLVGIVLAGIGVAVAAYLVVPGGRLVRVNPEPSDSLSHTNAAALEQLESALAAEVQRRTELADQLTEQLAELNAELALLRPRPDEDEAGLLARGEPPPERSTESGETQPGASLEASGFDDEALLLQGIDPRDVRRLHDLWVGQEIDRASITYQALREGWFFKARHRTELAQLDRALREELLDEDYDRYLYARGEPNRLRAVEVPEGSSASEAGLLPGDVILRYDDVRVFKRGDLLLTAARGEPGQSVAVEILRNGQLRTVYVGRGPLGVIMKPSRGPPLPD